MNGKKKTKQHLVQRNEVVSLKLKLVIDRRQNRLLFAEAGKDFVDFIIHILSLPVGTVTRILSAKDESASAVPGCLGRLYEGVRGLDNRSIDTATKDFLLNFKAPFRGVASHELLPGASLSGVRTFWNCPRKTTDIRFSYDNIDKLRSGSMFCEVCRRHSCTPQHVTFDGWQPADLAMVKGGDEGGYVKYQTYMVTDDLVAEPMSITSALSLMGPAVELSHFQNKEVYFGPDEAMKLLKASLQSKTVLTDVFLSGGTARTGSEVKRKPC